MRRILKQMVVLAFAAGAVLPAGQASAASCAEASEGGDWRAYGQDLESTRSQPLETTINTTNVAQLAPEWVFRASAQGGEGNMQATFPVADGCVYVATNYGYIFALNADTGDLVWQYRAPNNGIIYGPTVADGVVYVNVGPRRTFVAQPGGHGTETEESPYFLAFDSRSGELLWQSVLFPWEVGVDSNTSAVYFDGMLWSGIDNPEGGFHTVAGFVLWDASRECSEGTVAFCAHPVEEATGGTIVKYTKMIPPDQEAAGFAGGGPWTTAAVDPETKYGYFGSAQPSGYFDRESEFTNSIIKFDFDRERSTFGEIVGVLKGTSDGESGYIDVDYGGSPTIFNDVDGRQIVAELQKSGWVHAAYTRHMAHAWSAPQMGFGTALGNYTSVATDGTNVFGVGSYPGQAFSLNGTTGLPNWITPIGPTVGSGNMAYANGVVYYADDKGILFGFDAATGVPVLTKSLAVDNGGDCGERAGMGSGVVIARNTVYVPCGDSFIAYRLPA